MFPKMSLLERKRRFRRQTQPVRYELRHPRVDLVEKPA